MAAVKRDLDFEGLSTWHLAVAYLTAPDQNGDRASALPVGWSVKAQWRKHPNDSTVLVELIPSIDHATGEFDLLLTGEQTGLLPSLCWWGCKAYGPGGEPAVPLIEGRVNVSLAVVR